MKDKKIIKMKWAGSSESVIVNIRNGKGDYIPGDIVEMFDSSVHMICGTVTNPISGPMGSITKGTFLVITNEELDSRVLYVRNLKSIIKVITPSPLRTRGKK
jgi:hypothetical protein